MPDLSLKDRLAHAWNVFRNKDPSGPYTGGLGFESYGRPDRIIYSRSNEQSLISAIYTRIAIDVAAINLYHARLDANGRFTEEIDSDLNNCLRVQANIDQPARSFVQDVAMSLFDEGAVGILPVDTTFNPKVTGSYDIQSMRVAKILAWFPQHVKVEVYNDRTGQKEQVIVPKKMIAIVENPLYAVMNEPNSTLKRLVHTMNLLDVVDNQSASGKLDLIIQLPYATRSELRRQEAERRRKSVEDQLTGSKYGVAYIDGTEHVIQLNRSVDNNLMERAEYLTSMLYSQLGLTQAIFDGTADEQVMLNYYNRTVEPVIAAIADAMKVAFLTKTARTQGQSIIYLREPFKLVPTNNLADIVDKFTRNEVLSSNEVRSIIGYKPADDPRADELRNKNLKASNDQLEPSGPTVNEEVRDSRRKDE